ncbi:helix-turn-helix domain-containing protein [Coraliomargarita sp. SDUM461003]|uniref:Helix-turn-helix domain-containing protein n=1 Tax=Thalassobacterium maritimum TaxID=3041265 RepID=A0ABU1APU8_9BACT|nr:helix-turn-helix domain-containing protein [Coraliomargarita sp. SDUM461003]MDQ8206201.1 helix-turn-helix domain-containing protein [Coraliomargarita sp. SDUM461003]
MPAELVNLSADLRLRVAVIVEAVASCYKMRPSDLSSRTRSARVSEARHVAMYVLRDQLQMSCVDIARVFGRKDHCTVLYACKKIHAWIVGDAQFRAQWPRIVKSVIAARMAAENGLRLRMTVDEKGEK